MGQPVDFKQSNFVWKGWPKSEERDEVLDLPSFKYGNETISCWELTWKEKLSILFTGRVWLRVFGRQPPVLVEGTCPFIKEN